MIVLGVERHWVSPYVFACFVTLKEKALPFETRVVDASLGETKTESYLAETITGRVPTLLHDDFGLGESSAIVEYLEEAFPETPVLPRAPKDRARCRQLASWIRSDETLPLRAERSTATMFFASERTTTPLSDEARAAAEKLCAVVSRVLRPGAPHLFDSWCIVDSELAFILHRLITNGDAVPDAVRAYAVEQWKRPSVRAFVDRVRTP
jgi:glutathione S-transferase